MLLDVWLSNVLYLMNSSVQSGNVEEDVLWSYVKLRVFRILLSEGWTWIATFFLSP